MEVQREFKDRLFRFGFGNEKYIEDTLALYNALNNSHHTDTSLIEINTIDDVMYLSMKNDVSFIVDDMMCLWEIYAIMSQKTLTKRMCRTGAYIKTKWEFRIRYDANEQEGSGIDQLRTIQLSVYPTQIDCIRKTRDKLKITDLWFNCESEYHNIILHDKFKYYRVKNTLDDYWYKVDCMNGVSIEIERLTK